MPEILSPNLTKRGQSQHVAYDLLLHRSKQYSQGKSPTSESRRILNPQTAKPPTLNPTKLQAVHPKPETLNPKP